MFNKLFGGKKSKDGYYIQLDEASGAQSTNSSNGKKAAVVEKSNTEAVVVDRNKSESAPVKTVVEDKKNEKVKASKSATKTSKNKKSDESQTETASVAPAPNKQSEYEPPFWVQAMNANTSNSNDKVAISVESFAANNLMPLPNRSRRRPGPSLNPFMDMARQVKNSNSRI